MVWAMMTMMTMAATAIIIIIITMTNPDPAQQQGMQGGAVEIVAASVVHLARVATDRATPRAEWDTPQAIRHFSVVQHLEGQPFPPGTYG